MAQYGSNEWIVSLWLNNDQTTQEWANEVMREWPVGGDDPHFHARGDALQQAFTETYLDLIPNGMMHGIVSDMITHTDWDQIASAVWVDE